MTRAPDYNGSVPFRIRPFRKPDFQTLWWIDQICFDPKLAYSRLELAFYMRRPGSFTLVADAEGDASGQHEPRIVGFIVGEIGRTKHGLRAGHIITIDVVPEARRGGIGSSLLETAERQLAEAGAGSVVLETAVNNDIALRFYKQKGYFVEKTAPGYYANHMDALVMRKELLVVKEPVVRDS